MKTIKCLIVDDEAPARRVVEKFLTDLPGYEIMGQCRNAFETMEMLQSSKPDLMFLDINMPNLSGIQLLKTLDHPPLVIITTAYRDYAMEGFELDVVDYLHKPFSFERFIISLNKVRARLEKIEIISDPVQESKKEVDYIFVKEDKRNYRVDTKDIIYVQADGDYISLVCKKRSYLVYMTMKKMEKMLLGSDFIRVHRSFIVNLAYVTAYEGNRILIRDLAIPLGSAYKSGFYNKVDKLTV